ncbi:hypothetical protein COHA_003034 [Chlorella ohadii]|uniref:Uncharacterized protein n=1 Tax=Chlorella ohadii TaxID=2649997 RepID=A0AAD5H4A8_9CHLO|nr:hypothetical protein COHA_003034 [Chlorella ohadii]
MQQEAEAAGPAQPAQARTRRKSAPAKVVALPSFEGGPLLLNSFCLWGQGREEVRIEAFGNDGSDRSADLRTSTRLLYLDSFVEDKKMERHIDTVVCGDVAGEYLHLVASVGGKLAAAQSIRIGGNDALTVLAATSEEFERRGYMQMLDEEADLFLGGVGVTVRAVEAQPGSDAFDHWSSEAFGYFDRRALTSALTRAELVEGLQLFENTELLARPVLRNVKPRVPLTAEQAEEKGNGSGSAAASSDCGRPGGSSGSASAVCRYSKDKRSVEVLVEEAEAVPGFLCGRKGRLTISLPEGAGALEAPALADLVYLSAAKPGHQHDLLCGGSCLAKAEQAGVQGISSARNWEAVKAILHEGRKGGTLLQYLRLPGGEAQDRQEAQEGDEVHPTPAAPQQEDAAPGAAVHGGGEAAPMAAATGGAGVPQSVFERLAVLVEHDREAAEAGLHDGLVATFYAAQWSLPADRYAALEKEVCWMLDERRFKLLCNILRKLDGGAGGGATAAQGSQAA